MTTLIQELLRDVIKRMNIMSDNVTTRLDTLDHRIEHGNKDLRALIDEKLSPRIDALTDRVNRHESYFSILTYAVTGGLGILVSAGLWLSDLFKHKGH